MAQFEKEMLVAKLRGARQRKKAATGKCEGRKSYAEINPEAVALAKRLHRYPVNSTAASIRAVSDAAKGLRRRENVARAGRIAILEFHKARLDRRGAARWSLLC